MATRSRKRNPSRASEGSRRYAALLITFLALLCAVGLKIVWIQTMASPAYARLAEDQRRREIELPPKRGAVLDREGEPLAVTTDARTIYATPYLVKDKPGTAAAIASVLGGDVKDYQRKLEKATGFVYIGRKVDAEKAAALEKLDLGGIGFLEDSKRTYPSGELACQLVGFVGVDDKGLAGIEKRYNELLAGTPGHLVAERDALGRAMPGGLLSREEPVNGSDIVLTIDKDIQFEAQLRLAEAVKKWKAKSGSVVIMDPRNGEIYAMASVPGFDPNAYSKGKTESFRNRPVTDTYEPGSTIKSLTAASVLDAGIFKPDSKFKLPPTLRVGGRTIHESHARGTVTWSLTDIVTNSSNVGAVKLGQALGEQRLYEYFSRFGLTERTGIDFPGEAVGFLPPPSQWSASSIGNIPFGQGVSVTPLQLSRALGAIANGGILVTPHLLLSVPDRPDERVVWDTKRAISEEAAAKTTDVLKAVITEGTGAEAKVPGYTVAGKTGTAQKPRKDGRGYSGGGYIGSFSGFLPAEDPRVLIVVTLDEPRNAIYGGTVAAPTFSQLARFTVSHLKIPPATPADPGNGQPDGTDAGESSSSAGTSDTQGTGRDD